MLFCCTNGKLKINRPDNKNNSNDDIKWGGANDISRIRWAEPSMKHHLILFFDQCFCSAECASQAFNLFLLSRPSHPSTPPPRAPHELVAPLCSLRMENTGKREAPRLLLLGNRNSETWPPDFNVCSLSLPSALFHFTVLIKSTGC